MAKSRITYECQECAHQVPKWLGKCPNCQSWNSFVELKEKKAPPSIKNSSQIKPITEIKEDSFERFSTLDSEFDLVLGGGLVPNSLTLIGGSPGVGKSTLLLKVAGNIAKSGKKVLYVSGEESTGQIKLRANRLNANSENLYLLSEINLERILSEFRSFEFNILIVDSIQTIYSEKSSSAPGSVSQVREVTFELMRLAKDNNIAIFIIGHITKDGSIAGPRVLEHMVDTVLYFEGDSAKELRILRGFKNRFGSTSEVAIFEMTTDGLVSAKDISSKFIVSSEKPQSGSTLSVIMEGTRAILIEVQALVVDNSYGNPKRTSNGFDTNRLNILLALLEKKLSIPLNSYDVFINIAGGIKINETASDLAVIASIISSFRDKPLPKDLVFVGEVSLIGDIREVFNSDMRLKEAKNLGINKAIVAKKPKNLDMKCYEVDTIEKIIDWI
jgi:DNA repair protein RadA/Sms